MSLKLCTSPIVVKAFQNLRSLPSNVVEAALSYYKSSFANARFDNSRSSEPSKSITGLMDHVKHPIRHFEKRVGTSDSEQSSKRRRIPVMSLSDKPSKGGRLFKRLPKDIGKDVIELSSDDEVVQVDGPSTRPGRDAKDLALEKIRSLAPGDILKEFRVVPSRVA